MAKVNANFDIAALKKNALRIDNTPWYSFFGSGDIVIFRLTRLEPKNDEKDTSAKFYGVAADGTQFQCFASAIVENTLTSVAPGTVVMIEYEGKEKHPKNPAHTIKRYGVYLLGQDFPANTPSPDFEAIAQRIEAGQDS